MGWHSYLAGFLTPIAISIGILPIIWIWTFFCEWKHLFSYFRTLPHRRAETGWQTAGETFVITWNTRWR